MGIFAALWGITGIIVLLGSAIYRLTPYALDLYNHELFWHHWSAILISVFFMSYAEGYRGFQKRFCPRVAARALYLRNNPNLINSLFAPFFCMSYYYAPLRQKILSISLTIGIICLIVLVRIQPQPWRGIIDIGVVIGLIWGLVSLLAFSYKAFTDETFNYSAEIK